MKLSFTPDNRTFSQTLFYILIIVVPVINLTANNFSYNSIYVLIVIALGFGFANKSKWFLFVMTSVVVIFLSLLNDRILSLNIILVRLLIFLIVTFISVSVAKQYELVKKHKTDLVLALAKSLDARDGYTAHHSENVSKYALMLARELKLSKKQVYAIYIGGLLHDIGKIGIPESILLKPGRLTAEEFESIKLHSVIGYETLKHISTFKENGVLDMVLYHHERYDGTGYPKGLKGEEIPLEARIITLVDSFDAMTSQRVYRPYLEFEAVVNEIRNNKGKQYDPKLADVFLQILEREGDAILTAKQSSPQILIRSYSAKQKRPNTMIWSFSLLLVIL